MHSAALALRPALRRVPPGYGSFSPAFAAWIRSSTRFVQAAKSSASCSLKAVSMVAPASLNCGYPYDPPAPLSRCASVRIVCQSRQAYASRSSTSCFGKPSMNSSTISRRSPSSCRSWEVSTLGGVELKGSDNGFLTFASDDRNGTPYRGRSRIACRYSVNGRRRSTFIVGVGPRRLTFFRRQIRLSAAHADAQSVQRGSIPASAGVSVPGPNRRRSPAVPFRSRDRKRIAPIHQ